MLGSSAREAVDAARLTALFLDLVRIDSPSGEEGRCAEFVAGQLRASGWDISNDNTGPQTGNLLARLPGTVASAVLFATHLDVVLPCRGVQARLEGGWITSSGTTVLGADAKASVAALLEIARVIGARPDARPPVEMLFTWGEEQGHRGAKALQRSWLHADQALVLDALLPVGTIVHRAPSYDAVSIRVQGTGGHAGVDAGESVSAIAVAADALARVPWGQLDEATTANIGTITGGTARNAVAAEALIEAELRGLDETRLLAHRHDLRRAFEQAAGIGVRTEVEFRREYSGYALAPDAPVIELARSAYEVLGRKVRLTHTFGGSDANELNAMGISSCVLGIGAERCHSLEERIAVSELLGLAEWILRIVDPLGAAR